MRSSASRCSSLMAFSTDFCIATLRSRILRANWRKRLRADPGMRKNSLHRTDSWIASTTLSVVAATNPVGVKPSMIETSPTNSPGATVKFLVEPTKSI